MTTTPILSISDRLRACRTSAVHLEMRDQYMTSDPWYMAWHDGRSEEFQQRATRPWLDLIQEVTARGVQVRRARIVSEPVSDYIRFEYATTASNIVAGEQIRWLPRRRASLLALPGNDFWVFDDHTVLFNHFDGNGELPADDEETTTDPAAIKLCAEAFEAVWEQAIPHEAYRI